MPRLAFVRLRYPRTPSCTLFQPEKQCVFTKQGMFGSSKYLPCAIDEQHGERCLPKDAATHLRGGHMFTVLRSRSRPAVNFCCRGRCAFRVGCYERQSEVFPFGVFRIEYPIECLALLAFAFAPLGSAGQQQNAESCRGLQFQSTGCHRGIITGLPFLSPKLPKGKLKLFICMG
ncbi:MAG: hypothetical protein D6717_03060 [Gammaproteobacteria bacterium]|nr:MAG: hypothetical protein D6717_03060 [Gammaproteobacteria bacterium]